MKLKIRYLPEIPLPQYRYLPGKGSKDEHRKDIPSFKLKKLHQNNWKSNEAYLYGIDLFNHEFYYEAHEVWEELWFATGVKSPEGFFLKALIQLSGARLKIKMKEERPALRLFKLASENLGNSPSSFMGLDLENLLKMGIENIEKLPLD